MPQRDFAQRESSGARGTAATIPRQTPRQLSSQHRTHEHPPHALALPSKQRSAARASSAAARRLWRTISSSISAQRRCRAAGSWSPYIRLPVQSMQARRSGSVDQQIPTIHSTT